MIPVSACLLLAAVSALHLVDAAGDFDGTGGHDPSPDEYPVCGEMTQSPVNIEAQSTVFRSQYTNLIFQGYDRTPNYVSFKLTNKGHAVQVDLVNNSNSVGISGSALPSSYSLQQFHFHWGSVDRVGSEHTINGHAYPMELHLVHYDSQLDNISYAANQTDGLAVLGVFVEIGHENNTAFSKLIDNFDKIKYATEEVNPMEAFPLHDLLPSNTAHYYRYNGSLTTAPCYQSVIWTVFKQPIAITQYQLEAFRKLYHNKKGEGEDTHIVNNFRPTKPLNGRIVYRSYEDLASGLQSISFLARIFISVIIT